MAKKVTDAQVAEFLAEFRERKTADQESSPVWQELISFPQWGLAKFVPDKTRPDMNDEPAPRAPDPSHPDPSLPDPRLPASARADITKAKADLAPVVSAKAGVNTIKTASGAVNPWADYTPPPPDGPVSYGLRTDVPPPASFGDPSRWRRDDNGWHRKA